MAGPIATDFWVDYLQGMSPVRPWDKLILGGITIPGILAQFTPEVSLAVAIDKFMVSFDQKNGPKYKIRLTDKGYDPARIKAVLQVWTPDQWTELKQALPTFSPKSTSGIRNRDAYDITHPMCTLLGIKSVIVTRIGAPNPVGNQTLMLEIDMMQWFENTPFKVARPAGGPLAFSAVTPTINPNNP